MKSVMENQENLDIRQAVVDRLIVEEGRIAGVVTSLEEEIRSRTVIIVTGTFLHGLIHIGLKSFPAGRMGDAPSNSLPQHLKELGFKIGRMKTGTTPRLDGTTIDYSELEPQYSDEPANLFSYANSGGPVLEQRPCYVTYTNEKTHEIIRAGTDRSPMYTGIIEGIGARYCPSVEDKVMRFPEKLRHQIFLEPEGLDTVEIYPNGLPTSLPIDVQLAMLRSIKGLEKVNIVRPGYAIEYDYVEPTQLTSSLETKRIKGLFLAGQINGTSGYEEAAAQGLMAGINAVRHCRAAEPLVLSRAQAYIGVLVDDLITLGTKEPYRLFTSRAEYRLLLREDNADIRLTEIGHDIGLVDDATYQRFDIKRKAIRAAVSLLNSTQIRPKKEVNERFAKRGMAELKQAVSLADLLRRPELTLDDLPGLTGVAFDIADEVKIEVQLEIKYEGYISRQMEQVARGKKLEDIPLPLEMNYTGIPSLSNEVVEKLNIIKPRSLGQASRISGITPAAISVLQVYLKKEGLL
jgi:tRNA uridine 5-carboxymethylaminomethyl modification enzyme